MKILIVHRYFWPDQANCGQILWNVAKHYQSQGHCIDVLTSLPSRNAFSTKIEKKENEIRENVNIKRINLPNEIGKPLQRILNAIKIGLFTNFLVMKNKYDVIIATSVPAILGGFFSAFASFFFKKRFIYFCMDLYPEIGKLSGDFSNSILYKFLEKIDNWNCKRADSIIVHSLDMKKTLKKRSGGEQFKINIINNFSVPSEVMIKPISNFNTPLKKKKLSIIFVGNIGRFQGLEIIIDAMSLIKRKGRHDIELVIMGEGTEKKELINLVEKTQTNVVFFDYQPIEIMKQAIANADIGLVTLRPNIYKYAYPGKLMSYLEQGRPIISMVETESELVKTMITEGYGFSVPFTDIESITKLFINLADDYSWKLAMNKAALNAYQKNFSKVKILNKWSDLLKNVKNF
jgi:glycosyltransferase involved in cell wall biosynthesis